MNSNVSSIEQAAAADAVPSGRVHAIPRYFANFDGLRFVAFASVFLFHAVVTNDPAVASAPAFRAVHAVASQGFLGVNLFFVLSGFLITWLLLDERTRTGRIDIRAFYVRRALRIWPLYYATLLLGFVAFPWFKVRFGHDAAFHEPSRPLPFVFFLSNIAMIKTKAATPTLTLLWSVAVEEQFYLFWPWLVRATGDRRAMSLSLLAIVVGSVLFRLAMVDRPEVLYLHTFSVISDMALGALGATLGRSERFRAYFADLRPLTVLGALAGIAVVVGARASLTELAAYRVVDRLVIGLCFTFVVLHQAFGSNVGLARGKVASYLGKYTYGLYCLHVIGLLVGTIVVRRLVHAPALVSSLVLEPVAGFAVAVGLAVASFHLFEKHFLAWKNRSFTR